MFYFTVYFIVFYLFFLFIFFYRVRLPISFFYFRCHFLACLPLNYGIMFSSAFTIFFPLTLSVFCLHVSPFSVFLFSTLLFFSHLPFFFYPRHLFIPLSNIIYISPSFASSSFSLVCPPCSSLTAIYYQFYCRHFSLFACISSLAMPFPSLLFVTFIADIYFLWACVTSSSLYRNVHRWHEVYISFTRSTAKSEVTS